MVHVRIALLTLQRPPCPRVGRTNSIISNVLQEVLWAVQGYRLKPNYFNYILVLHIYIINLNIFKYRFAEMVDISCRKFTSLTRYLRVDRSQWQRLRENNSL